MIKTLYRGDHFFNTSTEPGRYRVDGIRSKAFAKFRTATIQREGFKINDVDFLNAVRAQIDRETESEIAYFDSSDLISFSEDYFNAREFMVNESVGETKPCNQPFLETMYLFKLEIDFDKAIKFDNGIFHYFYKCNPKLKFEGNALTEVDQEFGRQVSTLQCPICNGETKYHKLFLLDSREYVSSQKNIGGMALDMQHGIKNGLFGHSMILEKAWHMLRYRGVIFGTWNSIQMLA